MTRQPRGVSAETPTADLIDQLTPVDPRDDVPEVEPIRTAASQVNVVDWVDQQIEVPHDDDDDIVA